MEKSRIEAQPLVSVIVPIYNVEEYIERCIKSLINQDYKNTEIILVDDGSKDNSGQIIDDIAQTDNRIKVIHKKNGGVSAARNSGLEIATGEYILFVDGDDYVEADCVSYLLNLIVSNNCDIAMNVNNYTKDDAQIAIDNQKVIDAEKVIEYIYLGKIFVAVWNKIYKHSFLTANNVIFNTDFWYGEGMLFNIECLQYVDKVAIGERKVYHQVYNPYSAMRNFNLESNYCGIRSLEYQKKIWKKKNKRIENAWKYHYRCFSYTILSGLIKTNTIKEHPEEYKKCIKNLRKNITIPLRVDIKKKRKLLYLAAAIAPVLVAKRDAKKSIRAAENAKKRLHNID